MASSASYSEFGKQTVIYGLGVILSRAASFLMLPVYTRYLTPADYGILELLEMGVNVVAIFTGVAVSASFFKFYSDYSSWDSKQLVVTTSLITLTAASIFFVVICWPFSGKISFLAFGSINYSSFVKIVLVTYVLQSFIEIPMLYLRAEGKAELFVVYDLVKLLIQVFLCVYFVVFASKGVLGVLYSNLLAHAILSVILLFPMKRIRLAFSYKLSLKILMFGMPLILNSLGHFILTFSDRYFLSSLRGVTDVGIYSLAYKFGFLLSVMVYYPFSQVWEAKRYDIAKKKFYQEHFSQAFFLLNTIVIFVGFCIASFAQEVIFIMSSSSFYSAYKIVPIIVSAYIFQIWTSFCDIGIYIRHKTIYLGLATAFSAALVIIVNMFLISRYGSFGAAYATFVVFFVRFILVYYFSQRFFPINYGWFRIGLLCLIGISFFLLGNAINYSTLINRILFKSLFSIAFIAIIVGLIFNEKEKRLATVQLKNLYLSIKNTISPNIT